MRSLLTDVKCWFSRAEEARTIAEAMHDPEAARIMAGISAASYNPKNLGSNMRTVVIRIPAAEMASELAAMRKWLDEHGYDPAKFSYDRYGNIVSVYLIFEEDAEAEALRSRLVNGQQRSRASDDVVLIKDRWLLDFDGKSFGITDTDTMARACWCRLMAEEIRTEADGLSSNSAKDTMRTVALTWDLMAEGIERRLARTNRG